MNTKITINNMLRDLLGDEYIDEKKLFIYLNDALPMLHELYDIDCGKAFENLQTKFAANIKNVYSNTWINNKQKKYKIEKTIVVLDDNTVIMFNDFEKCSVATLSMDNKYLKELLPFINAHKQKAKRKAFEINLIVSSPKGLTLSQMEVNKTKLDLDSMYNDDFIAIDKLIKQRLNKKNDKGIVLLHGLPGTGKTTYLRYLIGKLKKKVLFLSPAIASCITNPDFINILIENPNCILIIEDAENIIMDRRYSNGSNSVSNLLNLSDGFLSDCLNVQVICTFNSELSHIDNALLRKGRLIARYNFDKLCTPKAQALSNKIGETKFITQPLTIAEIYNQQATEPITETTEKPLIGFRRNETVN